jgi:hypothetical protein
MPAAGTRVVTFKGMVASPRVILGAITNGKVAGLFNKSGSGLLVAIRDLRLTLDYPVGSSSVRGIAASRITTAPADGTLQAPMPFDTAQTHNANVEFRSGASADGTASTLTGTAGDYGWRQFHQRLRTSVEQFRTTEDPMLPKLIALDPVVLREGEGVLVEVIETASTAASLVLNATFEEFTYASGNPDVLAVSPSTLNFTWTS